MKFNLQNLTAIESKTDLLLVPVFEEDLAAGSCPDWLRKLDVSLEGNLLTAAKSEGFSAKSEQTFTIHTHHKIAAGQVALLGLGKKNRFKEEDLRMVSGRAAKLAQKMRVAQPVMVLQSVSVDRPIEPLLKAAAEGFVLGSYRFDRYRSSAEDKNKIELKNVLFLLPDAVKRTAQLSAAVQLGQTIATATTWARDLVNEPAGVMTPTRLANEAEMMAKSAGLQFLIGGLKEIQKLKMGMFLGVTQGSVEPPRLIHLWYTPKNAKAAQAPPLALIGKAITFDSGGLSLKTAEGMVDMKTDMAGSAAVLGAMKVIAELKPNFPVHAFMGACENMPSGNAYRPGDVLISRLGKTVEITNTDAEGRLVLGDILTWANEHKPAAMIDLATLTGACMVALGHYIVGAFGENDALMGEVLSAAEKAGEHFWRLPVTELQKDALHSEIADMKNAGERWAGATNAALFLKEFVGQTPWVHLDIAGPSQSPKDRGYFIKGATGVGVRTLVELVRQRMQASN